MRIRMTTSRHDFADGTTLGAGETHDVPEQLARHLIDTGAAEAAEPARDPRATARRRERAVTRPKETR